MWIWITLAVVLTIAAWVLFWLLSLPLWVPILVTAVALLTVVTVILVRILRARQRAAALERELLKQAANQADQARPDRRPEILALQAQMRQAIQALKKSKIGGSGASALYALPWYVIVGPPAAGKTTALEQSGLSFTTPGNQGPKIRGTAGTRNCDWWFSQHAILLDTAGRFTTQDDDRDEWFSFLDTVRRFRPSKPLEGIIVAISVTDLIGADDERIEELAEKLRDRISEMMTRLEMVLPIYITFTKVDLVAGFIEFWGDANKQQRAQAWGATFSLGDDRLVEPGKAFEEEFDILLKTLHSRLLDRLPRERMAEARTRILQFPAEFQLLRAPLARFIDALCAANQFQETPILRGFYFTSGTQVGRPQDRLLANMVKGFNVRMAPGQDPSKSTAQSYFVTDLLKTIVFPDREIAARSGRHQQRQLRWQVVAGAGGALLTVGVLVWAAFGYLEQVEIVRAASTGIAELKTVEGGATGRLDGPHLEAMTKLMDGVKKLRAEHERIHFPLWFSASPLYEPVRRFYLWRLRTSMEGPVRTHFRAEVMRIDDLARLEGSNYQSAYEGLKLYEMLMWPKYLNVEWAQERLAAQWVRGGPSAPQLDGDKALANTREYLDAVAADDRLAWPQDDVTRPRRRVCTVPVEELQYATLIAYAKEVPPVRADSIFYGDSAQYVLTRSKANNVEVPGCYTKPGWERIRVALREPDKVFSLEPWVCGETPRELAEVQKANADRLREVYFARYIKAWTDFFAGLDVQVPSQVQPMILELRAIEPADGPYARLFRVLTEHAKLDVDESTLLDKAVQAGQKAALNAVGRDAGPTEKPISDVEKYFRSLIKFGVGETNGPPPPLTQYLQQLTTLEVTLTQMEPKAAATGFKTECERTKASVLRLFGSLEPSMRKLIEPLLMNPIKGSLVAVEGEINAQVDDKWNKEVYGPYHDRLEGKYPFAESTTDVAFTDFIDFFRPEIGAIWKHYKDNLSGRLQRSGNSFSAIDPADSFHPLLLRCLSVSAEITDAIFGSTPEPGLTFGIKMQPAGSDISEISFVIDGKATVYRNEPERWVNVIWPAKDGASRGGNLIVKGAGFTDQIPRPGDFGLFRLLDFGSLKATSAGGVSVIAATWSLTRPGQPPITIQVRPSKGVHPFSHGYFTRLKCPPTAGSGRAAPAGGSGSSR